jgi:hypothetical protein
MEKIFAIRANAGMLFDLAKLQKVAGPVKLVVVLLQHNCLQTC